METSMDLMASVLVWGSIALLVWGASLVIGNIFASGAPREDDPARREGSGAGRSWMADGSLF